jgi:hypothetical protein
LKNPSSTAAATGKYELDIKSGIAIFKTVSPLENSNVSLYVCKKIASQ